MLELTTEERQAAFGIWQDNSLSRPVIGVNLGGASRFAGRRWPDCHVLELAGHLTESNRHVLLLAGAAEYERARCLASECAGATVMPPTSKRVLAGVIERLAVLVTSDTLALHLAAAVRTLAVALFGGTSWHEFETYDLGEKLTAELPCSPCYRSRCEMEQCMRALSPEQVLGAIERALTRMAYAPL